MSDDELVIYSSLRGWVSAAISPTVLLALGAAAVGSVGFRPIPATLVLLGAGLAVVVATDLPRHTRFTATGVVRVCLLRTHRIPWNRLVAIERTRPNTTNLVRNLAERDQQARQVSGGLIARGPGRKRWLLTDNLESRPEHDALAHLLDRLDIPVPLRAPRPHADAPPTDLYRRRRDR